MAGRNFHGSVLCDEAGPRHHLGGWGGGSVRDPAGTVRTEPWDELDGMAVGPTDGITVVMLFTVNRQRPFSGTVVVPRVCSPVGVVTLMVMVLPVTTDEVPAKSQV